MVEIDNVYDLSRPSAEFYSHWPRILFIGGGAALLLIGLPYVFRATASILAGHPPSGYDLANYLAIVGLGLPIIGFLLWGGIVGARPPPTKMRLTRDAIILESARGRRSSIPWGSRAFNVVLLDQSAYSVRSGLSPDSGFRIDGFPTFRAVLDRAAFDAILTEAKLRGLLITRKNPRTWAASAATPGTIIYRIRR